MDPLTKFQADRHPTISKSAFVDAEQYVLFQMQEYDYKAARKLVSGKRVLDWGCNDGYGTAVLSADASVVGLDVSPQLIATARAKYPQIDFHCFAGERAPFSDGSFDVVLFFQTIEHISNPIDTLREIKRVLKPGGELIVTTPNATLRLQGGALWNPFHVREYSGPEFVACLSQVFAVVDLDGLNAIDSIRAIELTRLEKRRYKTHLLKLAADAVRQTIENAQHDRFEVVPQLKLFIKNRQDHPEMTLNEARTLMETQEVFFYQKQAVEQCFSLRCRCL